MYVSGWNIPISSELQSCRSIFIYSKPTKVSAAVSQEMGIRCMSDQGKNNLCTMMIVTFIDLAATVWKCTTIWLKAYTVFSMGKNVKVFKKLVLSWYSLFVVCWIHNTHGYCADRHKIGCTRSQLYVFSFTKRVICYRLLEEFQTKRSTGQKRPFDF